MVILEIDPPYLVTLRSKARLLAQRLPSAEEHPAEGIVCAPEWRRVFRQGWVSGGSLLGVIDGAFGA